MGRCYQDCVIFVQSDKVQSKSMSISTGSVAGAYSWLELHGIEKSKREEEGKKEKGKRQIEEGIERKREIGTNPQYDTRGPGHRYYHV